MDNPRVIGYMPLHYGKAYLKESLLSVIKHVDRFVVLYTASPSHGHGTEAVCPDSEYDLKSIAEEVCGDKLIWLSSSWQGEGEQRGHVYKYSNGFDVIVAIDSDEVYKEEDLSRAIQQVYNGKSRYYGVSGYINFWRSFNFACYDSFLPIRFTNLHNFTGEESVQCTIYHFSCAQPREIMQYKYLIHGHASEIRPKWLEDYYYRWTPENQFSDLHPTSIGLWNATPFDKNQLPEYLKVHPYFNLETI